MVSMRAFCVQQLHPRQHGQRARVRDQCSSHVGIHRRELGGRLFHKLKHHSSVQKYSIFNRRLTSLGLPTGASPSPPSSFETVKIIIFNAQFLVSDTQFLVANTKSIIVTHSAIPPAGSAARHSLRLVMLHNSSFLIQKSSFLIQSSSF